MNSIDSSIVESTAQQKMFRKSSLSTDAENKKKRELKVLFVSKRDMCRGPMAECIFNYLADKYNLKSFSRFIWRAHSSGMDCYRYNLGNLPDQLSLRVLAENRLETQHGCRQASLRPWSFCFFSVARAKVYCNLLNFVRLMSHWDVEKFWEWFRKRRLKNAYKCERWETVCQVIEVNDSCMIIVSRFKYNEVCLMIT